MANEPLQLKPGMKTPAAGAYVLLNEAGVEVKRVVYEAGRRFPPGPKGGYYVLEADAPAAPAPEVAPEAGPEESKAKKEKKDKKTDKNKGKKKDKKKGK
jgi:hypothetical protein